MNSEMKFLWLLLAVGIAAQAEDWVEEEELEEPYNEENTYGTQRDVEEPYRMRRDVHDEGPYEEHVRVKRCSYEEVPISRVRRSADYVRTPRQVHQYEVHEVTDDGYPSSPPYEEMLAASAEHYHKVYAAPGAPSSARYMNPVSAVPIVYRPVPSVPSNQNFQAPHHYEQFHPLAYQSAQLTQYTQNKQVPVTAAYKNAPSVQPTPYTQNKQVSVSAAYQNTPSVQPTQYTQNKQVPISAPYQSAPSVQPTKYSQVKLVPVAASIRVADVPSSIKNPIGIIQAPNLEPLDDPVAPETVPVATVEEVPVSDDQEEAGTFAKHHKHATGHKKGGGHNKHGHFDAHRGGKNAKGFKQDHHVDKGAKGFKEEELHRKEFEEAEGKKKKHHDHADHKGSHEEGAHGHKGAKFDEKKGHKKGHKTKGYHNKYHKDEFHKEHKFYDDYHKSGEHHRFGKFNAKHASNESGKKKAHHVNAGHDFVERGKKGYSNKGHLDADHKGYNGKGGHEEHHASHSEHAKKGGKEGGAHWSHAKKN